MSVSEAETLFKKYWQPQKRGLAKYAQLVEVIEAAIESGDLTPQAKLPTETEFVEATSFSLGTVQRAMRILSSRGTIERRQGVGTFVTRQAGRLNDPLQCLFYNDTYTGFLTVYARVISRKKTSAKGAWSRYLGKNLEKVLLIERMLRVEDEFSVLSRFYLDPNRLGALEHISVDRLHGANFRALLNWEFGLAVQRFENNLRIQPFEPDVCKLLGSKRGTIGLILEAVAQSDLGHALYFQELFMPPNTRTLHIAGQFGDSEG